MIKGFYKGDKIIRRPFIAGKIAFPELEMIEEKVEFLVDTGADSTILSEKDALRLGLNYEKLQKSSLDLGGIGGKASTYKGEIVLKLGKDLAKRLQILILKHNIPEELSDAKKADLLEWFLRIPSLLGQNIIKEFGLYLCEGKDQVYLLTERETKEYIALPE